MRSIKIAAASFALALSFVGATFFTATAAEATDAASAQAATVFTPGRAPSAKAADEAPYLDKTGNPIPQGGSSSSQATSDTQRAAAVGCTPESAVDNPHISKTSSTNAVQAHGTWNKGTCTASTAHVTVCLYEYYRNASGTEGYWEQKGCKTEKIRPGGGSGISGGLLGRTTAHVDCQSSLSTDWRAHVDVDVDGQIDTDEKPYRQAPLACRVQ